MATVNFLFNVMKFRMLFTEARDDRKGIERRRYEARVLQVKFLE